MNISHYLYETYVRLRKQLQYTKYVRKSNELIHIGNVLKPNIRESRELRAYGLIEKRIFSISNQAARQIDTEYTINEEPILRSIVLILYIALALQSRCRSIVIRIPSNVSTWTIKVVSNSPYAEV